MDYYLNGAFVEGVAVESTFGATNTSPLYIGSRADLFTTFDGFIDDVALFDEVLAPEQIAQLAAGVIVPEPSSFLIALPGAFLLVGLAILLGSSRIYAPPATASASGNVSADSTRTSRRRTPCFAASSSPQISASN